jgi:RHS repeat-associated protein
MGLRPVSGSIPTTTGGDAGPTRTWSDDTEHFNDTSVIDDWPAGYAGLFVGPQSSAAATEFDDVTMWMDTDSDGTIDEQQFADDFSSNEVTLTYDDNGNLTCDGVFTYVYDGWNRLRKVQRVAAGPTTTDVALYEYYADNRRSEKIVQHSGAEVVENDGGDATVRFYYGGGVARPPSAGLGGAGFQPAGSRWNIVETRNGSDQATFQYVWGTQYVDELVLIDKNLGPTVDNDADADVDSDAEQTIEISNPGLGVDERYLVHQDRNWNVVALTDYDPDSAVEGAVVERYSYTPYGEVTVLNGVGSGSSSEFGNIRLASTVGNIFHHQGLPLDHEKGSYQNRWREYGASLRRFTRPDPMTYHDAMNLHAYEALNPVAHLDPSGLTLELCTPCANEVCSLTCALLNRGSQLVAGVTICPGSPGNPGTEPCCCICYDQIYDKIPDGDAAQAIAECAFEHESGHAAEQCDSETMTDECAHMGHTADCIKKKVEEGRCATEACLRAMLQAAQGVSQKCDELHGNGACSNQTYGDCRYRAARAMEAIRGLLPPPEPPSTSQPSSGPSSQPTTSDTAN